MAVNEIVDRQRLTRQFFIVVALSFPLIVVAGFARTYYLSSIFNGPPIPTLLVHLHGVVMTSWILVFMAQVWMIFSRRIKLHQRLGMASIALAVLLIIIGIYTAVAAAKYGSASTPPGFPPLAFMAVPIFDIVMFAILFGGAIYYRRRPAPHKRLMLLTVLNFLPPAIARLPIDAVTAAGPIAFFGIPDLLAIIFVVVDTWRTGTLNKPFAFGALLMIVSHPLRLWVGGTETWLQFASWITG
ncbi:MAG: hypothetical protein WKF92_05300 [Pyrinomonadaceae bacterium]